MAESEALISLIGQDRGLTKLLGAAGKSTGTFSDKLSDASGNLTDWNEGLGQSEKALTSATRATLRAGKGITEWGDSAGKGYGDFIDGAEKTIDVAGVLDKRFVGFGARLLGLNKPLNSVNNYLQPMAGLFSDVADQESAAGKAAVILDAAEKPVVNTLRIAATIAEGFAKQLESMGFLGQIASEKMHALADGLRGISRAVGVADTAGDILLAAQSATEFAKEAGPAIIETTQMMGSTFQQAGLGAMLFGDRMRAATTTSQIYMVAQGLIPPIQNAVAKSIAETILKITEYGEMVAIVKMVGETFVNAYLTLQNLNATFSAFEAMGIDTTYGKLALSMGLVGEGLILNREAAEAFTTTAIAGYAKLQDQLAYVRTLGSASDLSFEKLGGAMQKLVDGPLKNAITSTEAASSLYTTMSAGIGTVAQSTDVMAAGLKLSAGSGADATTSMEALIKTMSTYGIASRDSAQVAAKLNAITENGIITFPQLAGGFARVAGVAKATGVDINQLGGSFAALTYSMTADDALTGISSLLNSIAGQGAQSEAAIAALGIKFDVNTIKTKGLAASLKELYNATGGSTEKLKEIIPDSLAFTTAMNLMTNASGRAAEYTKNVAGATTKSLDEMFDRRREGTMQRATALMNGFQEVVIEFGTRLLPIIEPGISFLEGVLKTLKSLPEPVKAAIGGLIIAQVALGKTTDIGGSFISMLGNVAKFLIIARGASLLFSGQLIAEIGILQSRYLAQGRYGEALLRILGIENLANKATARSAASKAAKAAAEAADAAATNANTASKTINVTVENAATGAVLGHTTAVGVHAGVTVVDTATTNVNTAAKGGNAFMTNVQATATKVWTAVTKGATFMMGIFTNAINFASGAMKAFWLAFGPIALAIAGAVALFGIFQDFIPALGGVASESQKTAEGLDKVTDSMNKASESSKKAKEGVKEYSGNINKVVIPTLNFLANAVIKGSILSLIPGLDAEKRSNDFFKGIKDNMQAIIDMPVTEAVDRADKALNDRMMTTLKQSKAMGAGNLYTDQAKGLLTSARAAQGAVAALKGDDLEKALSADRDAMTKTKDENDRLVSGYKEQLETIKDPAQKAALQAKIDGLNQQTSALEKAQKAQENYLRGMNTLAGAVDANNAATSIGKTSEFILKQQTDTLENLPEFAKETARRTFSQIEAVTNKDSPTQRRAANKLSSAAKNMFNDFKNLGNINSPAELNEMRKSVDTYLDNVDEAVSKGAISQDVANKMRDEVQKQTVKIDTPEFKFEGSLLGTDQFDRIQKGRIDGVQSIADQELQIQQTTQTRISADQAEHLISEQEAQKQNAQLEIDQTQISLDAEKKAQAERTEGSQEYIAGKQKVAQIENQLREKKATADEQEFQREQQRQQRLAEIAANQVTQPLKKQLSDMDLVSKQLELQNTLMQSRSSLTQTMGQYDEARINNQLKVTYDIEKQAQLQTQLAVTRQQNLGKNQAVEQMSLEISLRQNQIATEREIINQRIAKAENERAISQARLEKTQLIRKKATEEELTLVDQQISSLEQQGDAIEKQAGLMEESKKQQVEVAQNSRKELEYKQAIAREGGALDVQLAKQRQIVAGYEKQQQMTQILGQYEEGRINNQLKVTQDVEQQAALQTQLAETRQKNLLKTQQNERAILAITQKGNEVALKEMEYKQAIAREGGALDVQLAKQRQIVAVYEKQQQVAKLAAQAVDLAGQIQLTRADATSKVYERQNQLLTAQKDLLSAQSSQIDAYFGMAIDAEKSDYRKMLLTREMNQIKLATLSRQQAMELKVFDIQQLQNKLALEREKIQNRVAKASVKAEIAGSYAELKKVQSTPGATPEQIQAAQLSFQAAIEKGAATEYAGQALNAQGDLQQTVGDTQREALVANQRTAYDQARFTAASDPEKQVIGAQLLQNARLRSQRDMGINPYAISTVNPAKPYTKGFVEGLQQPSGTPDFDQVRQDYMNQVQGQLGGGGPQTPLQQQQATLERLYQQPSGIGAVTPQQTTTPAIGVQQSATGLPTAGQNDMLQTVTQINQTLSQLVTALESGKLNLGDSSVTIKVEEGGKISRTVKSSDQDLVAGLRSVFTETKRRLSGS